MKLNLSQGNIVSVKDDNKFLVLAFRKNKLDSLGGICRAKDFRSVN